MSSYRIKELNLMFGSMLGFKASGLIWMDNDSIENGNVLNDSLVWYRPSIGYKGNESNSQF